MLVALIITCPFLLMLSFGVQIFYYYYYYYRNCYHAERREAEERSWLPPLLCLRPPSSPAWCLSAGWVVYIPPPSSFCSPEGAREPSSSMALCWLIATTLE